MKTIYTIFATLLLSAFIYSCQCDLEMDEPGYLRLNIETVTNSGSSRIIPDYDAKQIAVKITNEAGVVVKETNNYEDWDGVQHRLKPDTYTITASSYGFDGSESGFDIPYYTGSTTVTITSGKEINAEMECKLANVKVTVNFDESVLKAFQSANAVVTSARSNVAPQTFTAGTTTSSAYFPAENITSTLTVVNKSGVSHTDKGYKVLEVRPRDHIILKYVVAEVGTVGGVKVDIDGTVKTYTFTFDVSTEAKTSLAINKVSSWARFAEISAGVRALEVGKTLDPTKFEFEYKLNTDVTWTPSTATWNEGKDEYNTKLTLLIPNTTYMCRFIYKNGEETYASSPYTFTTEAATPLYNGGFEYWNLNGSAWYPNEAGEHYWDTSNPGSTSIGEQWNVTTATTDEVKSGSKSARLESKNVAGLKFAAASIYSGTFGELVGMSGAEINFGQPFTARPTQLTGWYNYTPAAINKVGSGTPASAPAKGEDDLCSIYIALTTGTIQVDNTQMSTFPDWNKDPKVVAYGALDDSQCGNTSGWKQFTIDLKYADLTKQPTHIVVVASSSKYGDYFTGGVGSLLYLDDFELLYDKEPVTK